MNEHGYKFGDIVPTEVRCEKKGSDPVKMNYSFLPEFAVSTPLCCPLHPPQGAWENVQCMKCEPCISVDIIQTFNKEGLQELSIKPRE